MKAIVTVVGKDKVGIVAGVATKIAELGFNIDDISQIILNDYFTLVAVVSDNGSQNFSELRRRLAIFSKSLNVKSTIQNAAIFDFMDDV